MSNFDDLIKVNNKKCSVIKVGGFRPTNSPFATNFSKIVVGLPDESWPNFDDNPLTFICQFNLEETPYLPDIIKDIKLITFFIDIDSYLTQNNLRDTWCIRAYKSLNDLTPLTIPKNGVKHKGFECKYELEDNDHPIYDDPNIDIPDGFSDDDIEAFLDSEEYIHSYKTKIGGWASNIQNEPEWCNNYDAVPEFCFQIASEEKVNLMWGDNGFAYIGRGTNNGFKDDWFIDIQYY